MTCDFCGESTDPSSITMVYFFYESFIDRELGHLDLDSLPKSDFYNCSAIGEFKPGWEQTCVDMFFTYSCDCMRELCESHRVFCEGVKYPGGFIVIVEPGERRTLYKVVDYEHTF